MTISNSVEHSGPVTLLLCRCSELTTSHVEGSRQSYFSSEWTLSIPPTYLQESKWQWLNIKGPYNSWIEKFIWQWNWSQEVKEKEKIKDKVRQCYFFSRSFSTILGLTSYFIFCCFSGIDFTILQPNLRGRRVWGTSPRTSTPPWESSIIQVTEPRCGAVPGPVTLTWWPMRS